jgi:hypothetical protein
MAYLAADGHTSRVGLNFNWPIEGEYFSAC